MISEMEDLNKQQIILLSLLISFVTSIATGIMTTSLLQQAPIEVTRNINRIVEKTIETVTPGPASTITKTEVTTVVVKEEDLIVDTIDKNIKSIVRIRELDPTTQIASFYGIGLILDKTGLIISDRQFLTTGNTFSVVMSDGKEFPLVVVGSDKQTSFLMFKPKVEEPKDPKDAYAFIPATFSDSEVKLGQTVVSVGGSVANAVAVGRVNSLDFKESGTGTTTTKYLASIDTDLATKDLVFGSPLFNLSGDVVGIKISGEGSRVFVPASLLKREIPILNPEVKPTQ
ncbi:MAG: S1C family serine protease [Patescibacteria group bacterium]